MRMDLDASASIEYALRDVRQVRRMGTGAWHNRETEQGCGDSDDGVSYTHGVNVRRWARGCGWQEQETYTSSHDTCPAEGMVQDPAL